MVARMPGEGFEPPTFGLQNRCTTTVLTRRSKVGAPKSAKTAGCGLIRDYIGCPGDDPDVLESADLSSRVCFKSMPTHDVGGAYVREYLLAYCSDSSPIASAATDRSVLGRRRNRTTCYFWSAGA